MATNSLGRLTLDLVAKIGEFVGPMTQAERKARDANKGIADSFNVASVAAKAFGAVVAGASVAGVATFVNEAINAGNEIKKFSQLANSSMSQFQYYAKGAETAGVSMESFADKMKDMQDRIGDFQQTGGGPLADFFENIAPLVGVTIQQLQKLSGPEALQLYYDSLEKVGASQNDMKFYMEAIISDSSLLIPLLKNGGEMFKFWGDAAKRANAIKSDEMIGSLEKAKVNLNLLTLQWQGFEATLVNNVMPVVQTVTDNFDTIEAVAMALGAALATKLVPTALAASVQLAQLAAFAVRAGVGLVGVASSGSAATGVMVALRGAVTLLGGPMGLAMLAAQGVAAGAAFFYMKNKSDEVKPSLNSQNVTIQELTSSYEKLSDSAKRTQLRFEEVKLDELNTSYDDAKSKLISVIIAMGRFDGSSIESVKTANTLAMQYKKGSISAEELASKINGLSGVSSEAKEKIDSQASSVDGAKKAMLDQQKVVDSLEAKNIEMAKSNDKVTVSVNAQAEAYKNLTQKHRAALIGIDTQLLRDQYIKANMNAGWSREKAEYTADYRDSAGLGYTGKVLSKIDLDRVDKGFSSQNYSLSASDKKKIAGAVAFVAANSLENLAKTNGLPENLLTGLIAQESGGKKLTSPTGATGEFQTTSIFRKEYAELLKAGNYSNEAYAQAAIKELQKGFKVFGNWSDAAMAYNGGVAGTKALKAGRISDQVTAKGGSQLINGQLYISPAKAKEMRNYPNQVLKYAAGVGGSSKIDPSLSMPSQSEILEQTVAVIDAQKSRNDAKLELDAKYYNQTEALAEENRQTVEKINLALGGDPKALKASLAKQAELFKNQKTELELNKKSEYQSYFEFETDRITQITQHYDIEKGLIQTNSEYTKAKKKELSDALERQKQQEIDAVKREEDQMIQSATRMYQNETAVVISRYKAEREEILKNYDITKETRQKLLEANSMNSFYEMNNASGALYDKGSQSREYLFQRNNPEGYNQWDMQNQYSSDFSGLFSSYNNDVANISGIEDESTRNAQLLEAHEEYLQSKAALDDEYTQREKDLDQQNFETKMQVYSQISGMVAQTFDQMAGMLEESVGKSNALYKTMFIAGKAASIAQAIVNTEEGATKALAQGGAYGSVLAGFVRATGYASVGMIAGQTIAGMAHDGIDNIPKEGTWLLDKGERVVDSRTNADLKNMIANDSTSTMPNVNVYTLPGETADVSWKDGELDMRIRKIARETINGDANNPNSGFSKAVGRNFSAPRKRP